MTHLKDLRTYIDALTALGDIQRIDAEVDLDFEIGAVIRRSYELRAPAPLFERIRGVEQGFRILGAPAGLSRLKGRGPMPRGDLARAQAGGERGQHRGGDLRSARRTGDQATRGGAGRLPGVPIRRGGPVPLAGAAAARRGRRPLPEHLRLHRRADPRRQLDQLVDRSHHGRRQDAHGGHRGHLASTSA